MENIKFLGFVFALIFGSHMLVEFMVKYVPYLALVLAPALFTYIAINAARYYREAQDN
jgi:hypothetical protein